MKRILFLGFLVASINSFAAWHVVKGNRISKTDTREVNNYESLASGGPAEVDIVYGTSNIITVNGDENILPYLQTTVKDKELIIKIKEGVIVKPQIPLKVHVTMTIINALRQSGSGSITGKGNFTSNETTLFLVSGSGSVDFTFDVFNSIEIKMSGSGKLSLQGSVKNDADIAQSGSGNINCKHLASNTVNAKLSGSGNMYINASKSIDAHISGSGNIYYTGGASVNSTVAGSGKIQKI